MDSSQCAPKLGKVDHEVSTRCVDCEPIVENSLKLGVMVLVFRMRNQCPYMRHGRLDAYRAARPGHKRGSQDTDLRCPMRIEIIHSTDEMVDGVTSLRNPPMSEVANLLRVEDNYAMGRHRSI